LKEELQIAIKASLKAGKAIMEIYKEEDFQVENKADDSPLTTADKKANEIINDFLRSTDIPIISEENKQLSFEARKDWNQCWIVDPLDGTKEFLKRNGEFTVNIALVKNQQPVLGVIYAPALNLFYYADTSEKKAFKTFVSEEEVSITSIEKMAEGIKPSLPGKKLKVVGSRSHMNEDTSAYIKKLRSAYNKDVEIVSKGSSLKFCLIADGSAHVYPRFAPTMEWDTAAGQAICQSVGIDVKSLESGETMLYNKKDLLNTFFLVSSIDDI
jgi:3'(2'), 5'-bisphosphate nucleotidase